MARSCTRNARNRSPFKCRGFSVLKCPLCRSAAPHARFCAGPVYPCGFFKIASPTVYGRKNIISADVSFCFRLCFIYVSGILRGFAFSSPIVPFSCERYGAGLRYGVLNHSKSHIVFSLFFISFFFFRTHKKDMAQTLGTNTQRGLVWRSHPKMTHGGFVCASPGKYTKRRAYVARNDFIP